MVSLIRVLLKDGLSHCLLSHVPRISLTNRMKNGTLNKVGWQPELRIAPKYMEKDLLFGIKDWLSSRGEMKCFLQALVSPAFQKQ